jgi:uncharacterized BrkB/YihY/UPF0761 family membrane protein
VASVGQRAAHPREAIPCSRALAIISRVEPPESDREVGASGPETTGGTEAPGRRRSPWALYTSGRAYAVNQLRIAQAARKRSTWVDTGFFLYERDLSVAGSLLAGALAYRMFLWLLPAALVVVGGLGFATHDDADSAAHTAGLPDVVAGGVGTAAEQAHASRWVLLIAGLVLLWMASRHLLKAMRGSARLAYGTGGLRERASPKAVAALLAVVVAVGVVHVVAVAVRSHGLVLSVGTLVFMTAVWALIWWWISWLLPHADAPAVYLVPGAALVGVGIQALYVFTAVYFGHKIASASHLYGTLGAAAALLLWLFIFARLVIGAAEVGAVLWERRSLDPWIRRFESVLRWLHLA